MKKALVPYFSATGVTAAAAKKLAQAAEADLFEIKPQVPYTAADLNWRDKNSRSTVEMRDKTSRPAMVDADAHIADYDTVFLGFPIWWYVAPTIINTFLERWDFSGKTVVLFATSGGSGFGKTLAALKGSVSASTVLREGGLLNGEITNSELENVLAKA